MFSKYIKIAWRNLVKHKVYSLISVLGLSIAILFLLMASVYVWSETRINKNLKNANNQYFLRSNWKDPNMGPDITSVGPLAKRLKETYPNLVANYYRWDGISSVVSRGDIHLRQGIQLGDSTLLSMFGFNLKYGNPATALLEPYSVVVTKELASKYFNRENVVGESLSIRSFSGSSHDFKITGVLADIPENAVTKINADNSNQCFIPVNTLSFFGRLDFENWVNIYLPSYIELRDGVKPADLDGPIKKILAENTNAEIHNNLSVELVNLGQQYYVNKGSDFGKKVLKSLIFTAIFILLMAMVNYTNISIGSSAGRSKEIGLRKVLGGRKSDIVIQFLTESLILSLFAVLLSLAAYPLLKELFEKLVGKAMPSLSSLPNYFLLIPLALGVVVGLLAGLYPALVMSSRNVINALKGKFSDIHVNTIVKRTLIGFQFTIAIVVLVAAIIVSQQIDKFFGDSLGYDKEFIVSSQVPRDWTHEGTRKMLRVRAEFAKLPQVQSVTLSYEIPDGMNGFDPLIYTASSDSTKAKSMQQLVTDAFYLETYKIPMKAGSNYTATETDSSKVVINETAVKALGWSTNQEAIGQQLKVVGNPFVFTVKGVVSDFHFNSLQQETKPIIMLQSTLVNNYRFLSFKLKPGNIAESIKAVETKWASLLPGSSFEYSFMDQTLERLYGSELQMKRAAMLSTAIAFVLVLMGILGMVSFSIQKRMKEVGVRKVLGAPSISILHLFFKEFLGLILIAGIVASPVAYLLMNKWLDNYVYRITITATPFLLAISVVLLVTILLIAVRTRRAVTANPINSLRTE